MCGIFGYTGAPTDAAGMVFAGLKRLEYRGYDSWGIAVGAGDVVRRARDVGKLDAAPTSLPPSGLALGHTRWATTGAVTTENAHPHLGCTDHVALVHNGIVENYAALRDGLLQRGHRFHSETDTEVAIHLLEEELNASDPGAYGTPVAPPLAEALRRVSLQLHGLNALAALDVRTGELAAVKNGSPLIVGLDDSGAGAAAYLASDMATLLAHTRRLVYVRDNQVVSLRPNGVEVFEVETGAPVALDVEEVQWRPEEAELDGYHHFLEKEIWEQAPLLRRIAADGLPEAGRLAAFLAEARALHFVACGTAYHAALAGRYLLALEAGRAAVATHAHEFGLFAELVGAGDGVVAFSQSGETIDVLDAMRAGRARGASLAALVNVPGSTLTREVDLALMLGAGPEKSVLSTKTFTAKVAYLALAAGALAGAPRRHVGALEAAAADIDAMRADGRLDLIRAVAHRIVDRDDLFVLGRGLGYPLALEAALKIKEVSYIHAEGLPAGELKHGTIALIEPGTPVLVFVPAGADEGALLAAAGEVKARGAYVVGVGPRDHDVFDAHLPVLAGPHAGPPAEAPTELHTGVSVGDMAYLLAASPIVQRLAYELALLRGADPDKPRNLAKSVTVR